MKSQDLKKQVQATLQQAVALMSKRKYDAAAALLEPYAKSLRSPGLENLLFPVLEDLGICYFEVNKFSQARMCFEEAIDIARKLNHLKGIASALQELSMVLWKQGELKEAIAKCKQALDIFTEQGSEGTSALHTLSILYQENGQLEEAKEALEVVIESRKSRNDLDGLSKSLYELGIVYYRMNVRNKAQVLLNESVRVKKLTGDNEGAKILSQRVNTILDGLNGTSHEPSVAESIKNMYEMIKQKKQMGDQQGVELLLDDLRSILRKSPKAILNPTIQELVRNIVRETGKAFGW